MRRLLLGLVIVAGAVALAAAVPQSGASKLRTRECGLPAASPMWIDFGHGGTVPFWRLFARPGLVSATANFLYPPQIRARGGSVVYMDLNFHRYMGGPGSPVESALVPDLANGIYDYTAASLRCSKPWIGLNELWGASIPTPWPAGVAQYRANVLEFLRILAARGAHPLLLVNSIPSTAGAAGDWWREVAKVSDLVREVYFPAPRIYKAGPYVGSRTLRNAFRRAITDFTSIGIPASRLGLMLGFQTGIGKGGREGLRPAQSWFETVKWQELAVRQVVRELKFSTIWSWGWAHRSGRKDEVDKADAACVWLWARDQRLCDGPKAAGRGFDRSLTEGQIDLKRGVRCVVGSSTIATRGMNGLAAATGDRQLALTALYQRVARRSTVTAKAKDILAAEKRVISARFGGSVKAYTAALRNAGASVPVGRGVLSDELARLQVSKTLRVLPPTAGQISNYYETYGDVEARPVRTRPAAPWLGGPRGIALASVAPDRVFKLSEGRWSPVRTPTGSYQVMPTGPAIPLAATPLADARPAIRAALIADARTSAYRSWSIKREQRAMNVTACRYDDVPEIDAVDLTSFLPFLALTP